MAIVASGEISLGVNSDVTRSVACELGLGGTTQICMDQTAVRALAAKTTPGSAIAFNDFYNKVGPPAGLGCPYGGGYYTGAVSSPANYYLIIAPNASGCACCAWKTTQTATSGASSCTDGYATTRTALNNADHPAGNWTATRSINGFSDWYLPARDELNLMFTNQGSMPAGQGYQGTSFNSRYWSSTERNSSVACVVWFDGGYIGNTLKNYALQIRAVRRVSF